MLMLLGCTSTPARWALELEDEVQCKMKVEEVASLTRFEIREHESISEDLGTHSTARDSFGTYVRFWFEENGLKQVQTFKEYFLKQVATGPKKLLCGQEDIAVLVGNLTNRSSTFGCSPNKVDTST